MKEEGVEEREKERERFIDEYLDHSIITMGPAGRALVKEKYLNENKLYLGVGGGYIDADDKVAEVALKLEKILAGEKVDMGEEGER